VSDVALVSVSSRWTRYCLYFFLVIFAAYYLLPLALMIMTSLKSADEIRSLSLLALPRSLSLLAWKKAWSGACIGLSCNGLQGYFLNSLLIVIPAVICSTTLGAINGYVLSLWKFRGADLIFGLILFGSFIPFQAVILPMARTLGELGLAQSTYGLILVHVIYGLAFTTLFFRNYYVTLPKELIKAAVIDGAGFFTIFWRIVLPLSRSILTVTVIWQFTSIWNDFLFGAVFSAGSSQPITVALNNLVNTSTGVREYNVDMAATLIAALPTLLVYIVAGKHFVRGLTAGAVKG
jgi:glucose/mannose transport system permease protein